jgi:ribosomal protein S18 acetylase RimI-like enzyme
MPEDSRPVTTEARIRPLRPSDFAPVMAVVDEWWGGRDMTRMLPRLFFDHFTDTSFAADRAADRAADLAGALDGALDGVLAGFLVGFVSQSQPGDAYIHFVGVHPGQRAHGLGRRLYGTFFDVVRARGCTRVRAVTSPVNTGSVAFHHRMGFRLEPGYTPVDGLPVATGYDGPGQDRVRFVRDLPS